MNLNSSSPMPLELFLIEELIKKTLLNLEPRELFLIADKIYTDSAETPGELADKPSWDADELAIMKATALKDLEYLELTGQSFKVKNTKTGQFLLFSNRNPTRGELRAEILRKELDQLKTLKPYLSLYDALTEIRRKPHSSTYLAICLSTLSIRSDELDEFVIHRQAIRERLISLVESCIFHMTFLKVLQKNINQAVVEVYVANLMLDSTVNHLGVNDSRANAVKRLQQEVRQIEDKYPQEAALLSKVLIQTNRVISDPTNQQHLQDYRKLGQEINQRPWGKVIGGLMLTVAALTVLGLCCTTGFGALAAIPVISWMTAHLIPTALLSGVASVVGVGLFSSGMKESQKSKRMDALANALNEVESKSVASLNSRYL